MLLRPGFLPGPSNHVPAAPLFGRFSLQALPASFAHPAPMDGCDLSGRFQLARTVYELRRGACSPVGQARQRGQLFEASREPPPKPLLRALTQVPGLPIAVSRLSAARHPIEPVYSSTGNGHFLVTGFHGASSYNSSRVQRPALTARSVRSRAKRAERAPSAARSSSTMGVILATGLP